MAAATDQSLSWLTAVTAVQMNDCLYSVYFLQYYSAEYEYTIRPTIQQE